MIRPCDRRRTIFDVRGVSSVVIDRAALAYPPVQRRFIL
jgi:hypothetical protein